MWTIRNIPTIEKIIVKSPADIIFKTLCLLIAVGSNCKGTGQGGDNLARKQGEGSLRIPSANNPPQ
jgi:hypothetical protein